MTGATASVHERLAAIFAEDLHVDVPSPDTDLLATARLDSLGVVELILQIERRFGVQVDLQDLELDNFRTMNAVAAFIASRPQNGKSPRSAAR